MAVIERAEVVAALPAYEVGGRLGAGTYGLVLAGRHRALDRPVAIKVLARDLDRSGQPVFKVEAQLLAQLDHPHVVRIFDYAETPGHCFLIMELLGGGTLARRHQTVARTPENTCAVGLAAAAALSHAHAHGVLHRDVKPDNMLFTADNVLKVADFGVAKIFDGSAITASRATGTPRYMAPEQVESRRLSPATDLYALGLVLYELLSGTSPFPAAVTVMAMYRHHLEVVPPPPHGVPQPVAAVIMRALSKQPHDRQPTAAAFALELADAAAHVYGPGWVERTTIGLHLGDGRLHDAVYDRPSRRSPPRPAPAPAPTAPAAPAATVEESTAGASETRWSLAVFGTVLAVASTLAGTTAFVATRLAAGAVSDGESPVAPIAMIVALLVTVVVVTVHAARSGRNRDRRG